MNSSYLVFARICINNQKKMQLCFCIFLFSFFWTSLQLTCSTYDYSSSSTVKCVTTCPSDTALIQNKCMRADQYITTDNQVHVCLGYPSSDRSFCCDLKSYISNGTCLKCNGNVYVNGTLCCSYDQYADFTTNPAVCQKISQGACSSVSLQQQFKVCCGSGLSYNIQSKTCTSSTGNNCDQTNKICCPGSQRLEYIVQSDTFACVSNCNWKSLSSSSFYCQLMYCNQNLQVEASSPSLNSIYNSSLFNQTNKLLLSFSNGQCCYGMSSTGSCYLTQVDCGQRFINRASSICCPSSFFYNFTTKTCANICNGYILFQFLCINNGSFLDLTASTPLLTTNSNCNGQKILSNQPYCCPVNFYINGNNGCTLCNGNIYQNGAQQICCPLNYYFVANQGCIICQGHIDASGKICCFSSQYVQYSTSGVPSCGETCALDNIYNTEYCCDSLTNSACNINGYLPTTCSNEYYIKKSCQGCPNFCSNLNTCTLSATQSCTPICLANTVYYSSLNACLSCDVSCIGCSLPFQNSYCNSCAIGFTKVGGSCIKCDVSCLTCFGSSTNCSSCNPYSQNSFLAAGSCLGICSTAFYVIDSSSTCSPCNYTCIQCTGPSSSQCTKCQTGYYLSSNLKGSCSQCSSQCSQCYGSSSNCTACLNSQYLDFTTNSCVYSCAGNQISVILSAKGLSVCVLCHPSCSTCVNTPQNCVTCPNNTQYLNETIGVAICANCISPCLFCSSSVNCTSCIDGYYFNSTTSKCLVCFSQCKTCYGGANTTCLTCFGDSILLNGVCSGCSASCKTCDSNKNCLQCLSPYYLFQSGCMTSCPNGTYGASNTCKICYSQCKTCINQSSNGCSSCNSPNFLVNGSCVGCSLNCKVCNANSICTQCNANYLLYQDNCLSSCPNATYVSSGECLSCPGNCKSCQNSSYCTQCNANNPILFNNECLSSCPSNYYKSGTTCIFNNTNNNTNNNSNNSSFAQIIDQTIILRDSMLQVNLYFSSATNLSKIASFIRVYLVDQQTSNTKKLNTSITNIDSISNKVTLRAPIPNQVLNYELTSSIVQYNSSLQSNPYVSSKAYSQFLIFKFQDDSISNIKYIGIFVSSIILIAVLFAKGKDHFTAQQANTLLLNVINFLQVIYFFSFVNIQQTGLHNFLNGFGFSNLFFFPNFFSTLIPSDYIQSPKQKSLNPDANIIRNAGYTFSFQLIAIGLMGICSFISYLYFKSQKPHEMPYIRKIMRITTFVLFLGYLNQLFFGWAQLVQPSASQSQYKSLYDASIGVSITIVCLIPLIMAGIIYHFYKTYNSDVLQHYYTLRQSSQYALIYFQAVVLAFSIGKPLVSLFLIPLQLVWMAYGYILYKYAEGYTISDYLKFIVCSTSICFGYLALALNAYLNWIFVLIVLIVVVIILIVYSFYQVLGLYYYQIFGKQHQK